MNNWRQCTLLTASMIWLVPSVARGQTDAGAIVSGSVAAAVIEDGTVVSVGGAAGYRFNRVIGLEVDVTSLPRLHFALPPVTSSPYARISYTDQSGDLLIFTSNVRLEIPTISRRVLPYAVGGGGIASTRQEYTVSLQPILPPVLLGGTVLTVPAQSTRIRRVTTGMALTVGGGLSVRAAPHLSVDVDLRAIYVRDNPGGSIGRFGVGASYRF